MRNSLKHLAICLCLLSAAFGGVCTADDCEEINPKLAVAALVEDSGGKILKVEETIDSQGCLVLNVRILIDGTVKAITIPAEKGA